MTPDTVTTGDRILRPVVIEQDELSIAVPNYRKTIGDVCFEDYKDQGKSVVFRAIRLADAGDAFVAFPNPTRGLICFCEVPVLADWTHFVVDSVKSGGRCVVAHPVCGDTGELLAAYKTPHEEADYRARMYRDIASGMPDALKCVSIAALCSGLTPARAREMYMYWLKSNEAGADTSLNPEAGLLAAVEDTLGMMRELVGVVLMMREIEGVSEDSSCVLSDIAEDQSQVIEKLIAFTKDAI